MITGERTEWREREDKGHFYPGRPYDAARADRKLDALVARFAGWMHDDTEPLEREWYDPFGNHCSLPNFSDDVALALGAASALSEFHLGRVFWPQWSFARPKDYPPDGWWYAATEEAGYMSYAPTPALAICRALLNHAAEHP